MLETDYRNGHASGGLTSTGLLMEAESQFTTTNPADGSEVADDPDVDTAMLPAKGSSQRRKPRAIPDGI
jgi:hypothetical protein